MDADIVVVGAGAAGLWAAAAAARGGRRVLVLEKTARAGTKILASGGTRCNLTTTLGPAAAARLFGDAEPFLLPALRALTPAAVRARFHALGVPTVTEDALEKVFPKSQRAVDVRDALLRDATDAGAQEQPAAAEDRAAGLDRPAVTGGGDPLHRGLVAEPGAGGQSYPKTGTTGDGYGWLRDLDLPVVRPVPALVPLASRAPWVTALSGIALPDVEARLQDPSERVVARRKRPVLFTHHGISGPGAMDLSVHAARAAASGGTDGWHVALDLLPDRGLDDLRAELLDAAGRPGGPRLARLVGHRMPARVLEAVVRQAGLSDDNPALHQVDRKSRNRLCDALKGLRVPLSGTLGWDEAEVTGGGLSLEAVDRATLEVHGRPGLHVFGELLDLTGPIGGLNFQAAFATAELAARAALS